MIEIQNLGKNFGAVRAVDSLSLRISSGTLFGLVGPNGAGKTTIVNVLTGMVPATSGTVRILGLDVERNRMDITRQSGVLPEGMALFEALTGVEHLTFVAQLYDIPDVEAHKRIEDLLVFFELDGAASKLIETFSLGMKKKLSFAAAIMHNPKVLFLDEPFESVDPISRKKMKDVLIALRNKGVTTLLTSHALETVEAFCDEVAIINKGKLVFQAKTEDIRGKIESGVSQETYKSLEEIFVDMVTEKDMVGNQRNLSWLAS